MTMFKIVTTDGTLVYKGTGDTAATGGLTQEQAQASADDRNKRAEELGIQTRYEVRPA